MRTSPTNIGLWMTSALGAHDCGYLTINQVIESLTRTMKTIGRLELHQGHLLNWYDIQTLAPLEPRYVSGVDSGNLLGALVALEQGLDELVNGPVLDGKAFAGFYDTGSILKQVAGTERLGGFDIRILDTLLSQWQSPSDHLGEALGLLREMEASFRVSPVPKGAASWAGEMEEQVAAWLTIANRYLNWAEILARRRNWNWPRWASRLFSPSVRTCPKRRPSLTLPTAGGFNPDSESRSGRVPPSCRAPRSLDQPDHRGICYLPVAGGGNTGSG